MGKFEGTEISRTTWPRRTKFREFKGNVCPFELRQFHGRPRPRGQWHVSPSAGIFPCDNPADANSAQVESVVEDFTSYKNRNSGIWARGEMRLYKNLKMADNGIGFTHASGNSGRVRPIRHGWSTRCSWAKPRTSATPRRRRKRRAGRSLPFPNVADFPIRGYEFYDFHHELDNNTFVNYQDNATRKTGAISYLLFTSFGMSSNNTVSARNSSTPSRCISRRSTTGGATTITATRSTRPRCSMTRTAPSPVSPIPTSSTSPESTSTTACEVKPTWNAVVCKGDVGRMNVGGGGGAVGFGGGGGRGGRGGAPGAAGQVAEGRAHPAHQLLPLVLLQVAVVLARVPPQPLLLHLLPLRLPQVVVESEVPLHLQGRQSFSAAMARSSPPTVQPTYERAPRTRSPPKGRPWPSACRNWMPARG